MVPASSWAYQLTQMSSEPSLHTSWPPSPLAVSFLYVTSSPNTPKGRPSLLLQRQHQSLRAHRHPQTSHNGQEYSDWLGQGSLCISKGPPKSGPPGNLSPPKKGFVPLDQHGRPFLSFSVKIRYIPDF